MLIKVTLLAMTILTLHGSDPYSSRWESKRRDRFVSRSEDQFLVQMESLHKLPWTSDASNGRYPTRFEGDYKARSIKPVDLGKSIENRSDLQKRYRSPRKKRSHITNKQPRVRELPVKMIETPPQHQASPIVESLD